MHKQFYRTHQEALAPRRRPEGGVLLAEQLIIIQQGCLSCGVLREQQANSRWTEAEGGPGHLERSGWIGGTPPASSPQSSPLSDVSWKAEEGLPSSLAVLLHSATVVGWAYTGRAGRQPSSSLRYAHDRKSQHCIIAPDFSTSSCCDATAATRSPAGDLAAALLRLRCGLGSLVLGLRGADTFTGSAKSSRLRLEEGDTEKRQLTAQRHAPAAGASPATMRASCAASSAG